MLRSFGVVGALAAAALALVIGIIAFNAHSNDQKNRPFAGGPQSGVADHPVAVQVQDPNNPYQFRYTKPADTGTQGGISPQGSGGSGTTAHATFGGATQASTTTAAPRGGGCGVVAGLLNALGGLLGGGNRC